MNVRINQDKLTFILEKTRRETSANPMIITVVNTQLVDRIIKEWGNKPKVKIKEKATSYVSRHSFATVLKLSGVSTEFIKESLGHSNLATAEKYLAGFEDKEQQKMWIY